VRCDLAIVGRTYAVADLCFVRLCRIRHSDRFFSNSFRIGNAEVIRPKSGQMFYLRFEDFDCPPLEFFCFEMRVRPKLINFAARRCSTLPLVPAECAHVAVLDLSGHSSVFETAKQCLHFAQFGFNIAPSQMFDSQTESNSRA
jgi:hypothetical protein